VAACFTNMKSELTKFRICFVTETGQCALFVYAEVLQGPLPSLILISLHSYIRQ